jgi:signal transduction histidine kinase
VLPREASVWVVDDSSLAQEAVRAALAGRFSVTAFDDGASMLEKLEHGEPPDLLLLDWAMPDLSGPEICNLVRERYDDFRLPVVIITGVKQRIDAAEALAAGANDFITKPFTKEELVARIEAQLRIRRHAADRISQSDLERQLVGIVSHDLRNPIGAVRLTASLMLRREGRDERDILALQRIVAVSERANRMIVDLLDYTQASLRGELPIRIAPADLGEVARQVVDEHRTTQPTRSFTLEVDGDTKLEGDADRLAQVAGNLISNAIAHGSVEHPIRVMVRGVGRKVQLVVTNRGEAIPEAVQARMFKPFQRGDAGRAGQRSVGLGLYIVDHVVRAHGGTIELASADGENKFCVTLPKTRTRSSGH